VAVEVSEVIRLQNNVIESLPTTIGNRYIRGSGKERTRLILLDVDKLFDEEEMQELKKVG
jgi:chemotaxis signal transduction protein